MLSRAEALCEMRESNRELSTVKFSITRTLLLLPMIAVSAEYVAGGSKGVDTLTGSRPWHFSGSDLFQFRHSPTG